MTEANMWFLEFKYWRREALESRDEVKRLKSELKEALKHVLDKGSMGGSCFTCKHNTVDNESCVDCKCNFGTKDRYGYGGRR